jgi:hypothetical protein
MTGSSSLSSVIKGCWTFFPIIVLAVALGTFLTQPQPSLDWEGRVLPAAQRYMEHYYYHDNNHNHYNHDIRHSRPLTGLNVVITGATSGIGLEVTRKVFRLGANVIVLGRSPQKLEDLKDDLLSLRSRSLEEEGGDENNSHASASSSTSNTVTTVLADLTDLQSVARAANEIIATVAASAASANHDNTDNNNNNKIDMLINNAGIHAKFEGLMKIETTAQGYDLVFGGKKNNSRGKNGRSPRNAIVVEG